MWREFSRKYGMTQADWAEWRADKRKYRGGSRCPVCGTTLSPLLTFLKAKGKLRCCGPGANLS